MKNVDKLRRLGKRLGVGQSIEADKLQAKYERRSPTFQNSVDLVPGWVGAFPDELGLDAGSLLLNSDPRIDWVRQQYGPFDGKSVLELGPLEGGHSYMFERLGAAEVLAIEANKQAFLRCLIAKEIYGLTRCRFLLGDFERFLEETDREFDIIMASGVLYHMKNPVQVLDNIGHKTNTLILWTHYFDGGVLHEKDPRRSVFSGDPVPFEHKGSTYTLHRRSYFNSWDDDAYCGGPDDTHFWMERPEIVSLCERNGFDDIQVAFEDDEGPNGPSCLFLMRKSETA